MVRCAAAVGLTHLNHGPGPGIESGAWGDGQMRITVELRTGHSHHDDWAIITRFSLSAPSRFDRQITTFVRSQDGSWRRDDETHPNVLIDTARVPALLAAEGIQVKVASAFGTEQLPTGLRVLIGQRTA